jgi:hypothetical protein
MLKHTKSWFFVFVLLTACLAAFPAWANASGGGVGVSLRLHGGYSYLQAEDINAGTGGFFDFYSALAESMGYTTTGGFSPAHSGYDVGADLVLQLNRYIGIGIGAGYLQASKSSLMTLSSTDETVTMSGMPKLSAMPIRLGVFFTVPLNDRLNLTANAGAAYYAALKLKADLRLESATDWQEMSLSGSRSSFDNIGFQGGLGFEYMITQKLGFFVEAQGRYARFKNFDSVTGVASDSGGGSDTTTGKLYLETFTGTDGTLTTLTIEETPPTSNPPDDVYTEPKIDLSGFCFQAGIHIRF